MKPSKTVTLNFKTVIMVFETVILDSETVMFCCKTVMFYCKTVLFLSKSVMFLAKSVTSLYDTVTLHYKTVCLYFRTENSYSMTVFQGMPTVVLYSTMVFSYSVTVYFHSTTVSEEMRRVGIMVSHAHVSLINLHGIAFYRERLKHCRACTGCLNGETGRCGAKEDYPSEDAVVFHFFPANGAPAGTMETASSSSSDKISLASLIGTSVFKGTQPSKVILYVSTLLTSRQSPGSCQDLSL